MAKNARKSAAWHKINGYITAGLRHDSERTYPIVSGINGLPCVPSVKGEWDTSVKMRAKYRRDRASATGNLGKEGCYPHTRINHRGERIDRATGLPVGHVPAPEIDHAVATERMLDDAERADYEARKEARAWAEYKRQQYESQGII